MKITTLFLLTLCAVALTGCENNKTQEQIDTYIATRITEFNYKSHKYLLYTQPYAKGGVGGITHDPDCPCHKTNSER